MRLGPPARPRRVPARPASRPARTSPCRPRREAAPPARRPAAQHPAPPRARRVRTRVRPCPDAAGARAGTGTSKPPERLGGSARSADRRGLAEWYTSPLRGSGAARRESGDGWGPGSDVLPAVRVALWGARRGRGRDVRRAAPRPVPPDRQGNLREGQGGARDRLPPLEAPPPAAADQPQGCRGPGVGADHLGRGAGHGCRTADDRRCLGRARVGGVQFELAVHVGDQRRRRLGSAADPCLRQPELLQLHGAVRVGPVPRTALHVRRLRARRLSAGPRERRLHPLLGLQPVRRPPRPRDEHRRRGRARREADRRRPAQGGPRSQGRPLAAGPARHRRGARPVPHARDDRERLVRRRLRPRLDQRC